MFSLAVFKSRFEATQRLLWGGPRNFESWSVAEDSAGAGTPFSKHPRHTNLKAFGPDEFSVHQTLLSGTFTDVPNWNSWNTERKKNLSSRSKTYEIWSKWIRRDEIQKNSKSKTPSADSNLGSRCEASGKTIVLIRLGPRVEARNETRNPPCGGRGVWLAGILRL
ncbi:hypothetical protein AVEN_163517-1 [Araneus ventricosus]|uniref:Uncharacterized protein n=1 Tax=Araneus ventricosus TaxID=182803 RepID=A0A4Y2BRY3_ARAVE|nr:hypothetical protein AVEN_163517-1 [Araneus ventricosus]